MTLCYPFCQSRSECCAWAPLTNVLLNFLPCMVFSLTFHLHEIGPQSMFAACCTKTVIKHGVPQAVRMAGVSGGLVLIENQTANYVEKEFKTDFLGVKFCTSWSDYIYIIYIYYYYIPVCTSVTRQVSGSSIYTMRLSALTCWRHTIAVSLPLHVDSIPSQSPCPYMLTAYHRSLLNPVVTDLYNIWC